MTDIPEIEALRNSRLPIHSQTVRVCALADAERAVRTALDRQAREATTRADWFQDRCKRLEEGLEDAVSLRFAAECRQLAADRDRWKTMAERLGELIRIAPDSDGVATLTFAGFQHWESALRDLQAMKEAETHE